MYAPNPNPTTPSTQDQAAIDQLIDDLGNPAHTLTDLAARHGTTVEGLCAFLARPEIAVRLDNVESVVTQHNRRLLARSVPSLIHALVTIIRDGINIAADPARHRPSGAAAFDDLSEYRAAIHDLRRATNARRAVATLVRLLALVRVPAAPRQPTATAADPQVPNSAATPQPPTHDPVLPPHAAAGITDDQLQTLLATVTAAFPDLAPPPAPAPSESPPPAANIAQPPTPRTNEHAPAPTPQSPIAHDPAPVPALTTTPDSSPAAAEAAQPTHHPEAEHPLPPLADLRANLGALINPPPAPQPLVGATAAHWP